jgi:hypothetical protein
MGTGIVAAAGQEHNLNKLEHENVQEQDHEQENNTNSM